MKERILVSVIVPVHNAAEYLKYCVESLQRQTCKVMEILLIENGSSDDSLQICKQYETKDSRIRAYHLDKAGVSRARNFGISRAKGRYVMFADSDDYVMENWCSELLVSIERNKEICLPICGYRVVAGYYNEMYRNKFLESEALQEATRADILKIFKQGMLNVLWNKVYDRNIIIEHDLRMREDLTLGEDLLFNLDYIDVSGINTIILIKQPLYSYVRCGRESLDNRYYKNLWELTNLFLDKIKYFCDKWDILDEALYADIVYYYYIDLLKNTFSEQNTATITEKFSENRRIMQDKRFKETVSGKFVINGCWWIELWFARKGWYIAFYVLKRLKRFGNYVRRKR